MHAIIYARYSSDHQREASIDDQIRLCRAYADKNGWDVVETYADRAISGASLLRPGYQALMDHAMKRETDIVLAESLDRLSRDQEETAGLFKRLKFFGVELITATEGPITELHVGLKGTMNALYLKDLADKTRRGLEGRVRAGRSGGGNSYGYDVVHEQGPDGELIRGKRRINNGEAAVIRRVFEAYAGGASPRKIARQLNDDGIAGPSGGLWRDTSIRGHIIRGTGILNNDLYVGRLVWNRLRYVKDPLTGKRVSRLNEKDAWITKEVPDLRIITDDLWDRVKARQHAIRISPGVEKARARKFWEGRRAQNLLTGLAFCSECGSRFAAIGRDYLGCSSARGSGNCTNNASVRRPDLENLILDGLKTRLMAPELVEEFITEFHAELNRQRRDNITIHAHKQKELAAVTKKLDGLYDAIADGLRTEGLKTKVEGLEAEQQRMQRDVGAKPEPTPLVHPNLARLYAEKVATLRDALVDDLTRDEALGILRTMIERVEIGMVDQDGSRPLELIGEITGMIEAAHGKTPAGKRAGVLGSFARSAKVVAGVGFEPTTFRL